VVINGHVHEVELTGLPLGVLNGSEYAELSGALRHGDTVLLYTDGVVEATNVDGEIFGYDRLTDVLHANDGLKPRALLSALLHELRAWSRGEQTDDITMVIVRRRRERVAEELRSVAEDVLGHERAAQLWEAVSMPDDDEIGTWGAVLPELVRTVQTLYGRGLARELNGQLRLALEEYR
jgi:sigma-B regulation protein RsbU (phosphoserine phosphatase)